MKEYIERAAVKEMLENAQLISDGEYCGYCTEDVNIDSISAADVVEVVRCRECKHSSLPSGFTQRYGEPGTLICHYGPCNRRNVKENDFCSNGQRKDPPHDPS